MSSLSLAIDDYLDDCRARGLSLKTVEDSYAYSLRTVLLPWLEAQGIDSARQIDSKVVMRWQADLLTLPGKRGTMISRYTIRSWVGAVNMFLRWAKQNGEMTEAARGRAPRPPKVLIDVLTRQEIDQMEQRAQTERDKLIVRILADTGLRAGELLGLRVGDLIERDRNFYLRVRGKGDKERMVPVPRLGVRIRRYVREQSGYIFVTLRQQNGHRSPLTPSGLQKLIRSLAREAKLTKRVHPHLLRHSYATWALSRGMNPIQLADILGHVGLTMIQRNYAHLSSRDAYDAQARLFASE
jgi:integrase/recombinase XerD